MIFIVSSTGILIYKTHCSCTGTEQVGVYVMPKTCENESHLHHTHNQQGQELETNENCCHDCSSQATDCGCTSPKVEYIKLMNRLSEEDISFIKVQPLKIFIPTTYLLICSNEITDKEVIDFYTDPPPKISKSKSFLIEVHQLKIPFLA